MPLSRSDQRRSRRMKAMARREPAGTRRTVTPGTAAEAGPTGEAVHWQDGADGRWKTTPTCGSDTTAGRWVGHRDVRGVRSPAPGVRDSDAGWLRVPPRRTPPSSAARVPLTPDPRGRSRRVRWDQVSPRYSVAALPGRPPGPSPAAEAAVRPMAPAPKAAVARAAQHGGGGRGLRAPCSRLTRGRRVPRRGVRAGRRSRPHPSLNRMLR